MQRRDIVALFFAFLMTAAMIWGLVYFVNELWPVLPAWLSVIVFIFLAVAIIGYPIYALARWSDRYLERHKKDKSKQDPSR